MTIEEDDVLVLEDVERLGGIAVDMERRTEAGRFLRLEELERPIRLFVRCLDGHPKPAEIDWPAFVWPQNDRCACRFIHALASSDCHSMRNRPPQSKDRSFRARGGVVADCDGAGAPSRAGNPMSHVDRIVC